MLILDLPYSHVLDHDFILNDDPQDLTSHLLLRRADMLNTVQHYEGQTTYFGCSRQ